ncbi:MAG: hypothetical protein AAGE89_17945, partial [Pseudomonadota bacterium]
RTEHERKTNCVQSKGCDHQVLLMQVGFLFLEAGMVRSKNSINVAQKNISDLVIAALALYTIGFAFMFGPSLGGLLGFGGGLSMFSDVDAATYAFFVFQVVFVGTAATIVSGAVAERMKFAGYLIHVACACADYLSGIRALGVG